MCDTLKFKVGDRVTHKNRPQWGVGTIAKINDVFPSTTDFMSLEAGDAVDVPDGQNNPYCVEFPNGAFGSWWTMEENLIPVVEEQA